MKLAKSLIVVSMSLCTLTASAFSQTYFNVSSSTRFYCGVLPNGKTKILQKEGRKYEALSLKVASKIVASDISQARRSLQILTTEQAKLDAQIDAIKSGNQKLIKNPLSAEDIKDLARLI